MFTPLPPDDTHVHKRGLGVFPDRPLPTTILTRPLIRLYEISLLLGIDNYPVNSLRKLCAKFTPRITPIKYDEPYDDLLSVTDTHRLIRHIVLRDSHRIAYRNRVRQLDRISLILWMCGLYEKVRIKPKPYSLSIEYEIRRIRKLPEPQKTQRALDLVSRYADARHVAEAVVTAGLKRKIEKIQRELNELCGIAKEK